MSWAPYCQSPGFLFDLDYPGGEWGRRGEDWDSSLQPAKSGSLGSPFGLCWWGGDKGHKFLGFFPMFFGQNRAVIV